MKDVEQILDITSQLESKEKPDPILVDYLNYSLALFVHLVVINDLAMFLSRLGFSNFLRKFVLYPRLTDSMSEKVESLIELMKKHSGDPE